MPGVFGISDEILSLAKEAEARCLPLFSDIDKVTELNQRKVLAAFIGRGVSEQDLTGTTGYGYGDRGREKLDEVTALCFGADDALMRHNFASGTATLTACLFGLLRPGDVMLCVTGTPYDTIRPVIGINGGSGMGSLRDFGITYKELPLTDGGAIDNDAVAAALKAQKVRLVYIQRSRGYTLRPSLSVKQIADTTAVVRANSDALIMVDNCYGEFVEPAEPTECGVDLIAGSLIKNPGGGLARCGGYCAGTKECVELVTYRMTAPGVGREIGATLGNTRDMFMGLFSSPHVVGEAKKTAVFAASLFDLMGFGTTPRFDEKRADIIQAILLRGSENLIAFCKGLQAGSPVDSYVTPEPWDMPGYDSKVIMAAGTFISGASIELSGDAPLREPYAVWMQGGLNYYAGKIGIMKAAQEVLRCAQQ